MRRMITLLDDHLEEILIFIAFASMSLIIFFQVIMRYVFQASLYWSEEAARYLFIWLIYIGVSYGAKKDAHIAVTALDLVLNEKQRKWIKLTASLLFFGFATCACYYGREVCSIIGRLGQQSPAMDVPMWVIYAAVPTGYGLTCIRLAQKIRRQILNWNVRTPASASAPAGGNKAIKP